jgi:membrane protein required for colicin V production
LLVYDQISGSFPFVEKKKVKESVLYEPVKNLAPTIFPKLIKVSDASRRKKSL